MKIFLYTYLSKYSKLENEIEKTYRVRTEKRDEAEFMMVNGCADLITKDDAEIGRLESMKLIKMKEI